MNSAGFIILSRKARDDDDGGGGDEEEDERERENIQPVLAVNSSLSPLPFERGGVHMISGPH